MGKPVEIEVVAGLCRIEFKAGCSLGPCGSDTSPGVGFNFTSDVEPRQWADGKWHAGSGVIGRAPMLLACETSLKSSSRATLTAWWISPMSAIWITRDKNGIVDAAYVAAYTQPAELKALKEDGRKPELVIAKSVVLNAPLPPDAVVVDSL